MLFGLFLLLLLHNESSAMHLFTCQNNVNLQPQPPSPVSYEIKLIPNIVDGDFTFHGQTKINGIILEESSRVIINSKDLWIDENFTSLVDAFGVEHKPKEHIYKKEENLIVIEFQQPIALGNYTMNLKYAGNMTSEIYTSSYVNEEGETKWFVAKNFDPKNAGTAFPFLGNVNDKATVDLSIKHYPNFTAVSNTPVIRKSLDSDGKMWTEFDTTPLIPVYQVGFVVSDFDCIQNEKKNLSLCGRKEFLPYLKHPLDVTEKAIDFMEKYFDSKYYASKLEQFAVPDEDGGYIYRRLSQFIKYVEPDFKQGNMLLATERGAVIVSEEVAGDWIDYLISKKNTWGSTWITRSLSDYLGYYIVDKLFPEWREKDVFLVQSFHTVGFMYDQTYPDIYDPMEGLTACEFSDGPNISFAHLNRGHIMFSMMSNILSENTFNEGVRKFLQESQYSPANSENLWKAMQSAYDENNKESSGSLSIKEVMNSWIQQIAHPIVNVKRDYENGRVTITQEPIRKNSSIRYWIPINFATKSNPNFENTRPTHWLKPDNESLIIDGIDNDDWIIVNIQQTGYYRVDYDDTNWKKIADYMNTKDYKKIHVRNRAQLINDLFAFTTFERHDISEFLNLVQYLAQEDDYLPWFPTIRAITRIRFKTYRWDLDQSIKKFFLGLMDKVTQNIDFEDIGKYNRIIMPLEKYYKTLNNNETFFTRRFGNTFVYAACGLGHPSCMESETAQARAFFSDPYQRDIQRVPGITFVTFCDKVSNASEDEMIKNMKNATNLEYVEYLACSVGVQGLKDFVSSVIRGKLNPSALQLTKVVSNIIVKSKYTLNTTLYHNGYHNVDYVLDRVGAIAKYLEKVEGDKYKLYISRILCLAVGNNFTTERLQKIIYWANRLEVVNEEFQKDVARETRAIEWRNKNFPKFSKWFADHANYTGSAL